jgi:hypothetical protein
MTREVERLASATEPALQAQHAGALIRRAQILAQLGELDEAVLMLELILARFEDGLHTLIDEILAQVPAFLDQLREAASSDD